MPFMGGTVDMSDIDSIDDLVDLGTSLRSSKSEEEIRADAIALIKFFRDNYLRRAMPNRFAEIDRKRAALRRAASSAADSDDTASTSSREAEDAVGGSGEEDAASTDSHSS